MLRLIQKRKLIILGTMYTIGRIRILVHELQDWLRWGPGEIELLNPEGLPYFHLEDGHDGSPWSMLRFHVGAHSQATCGETLALLMLKYDQFVLGLAVGAFIALLCFVFGYKFCG